MRVKALDGVVLAGTAYGSGAAGVALFHEANATSAVWAAYAPALAARGVLVLAIDARGHGQSPDPAGRPDPAHYPLDGQAAVTWLRAHGARSITLVGASVGATLALFTAERPNLHIAAVVSLSGSAYDPTMTPGASTSQRPAHAPPSGSSSSPVLTTA
ncbi:MAG: alpha/beta hydrolase [Frankiaceae bacterium]